MPVVGTVVSLRLEDDMGAGIVQTSDGQVGQPWSVGRIVLWEQDARAARSSAHLGLVVLSPLMHNADTTLIETVAPSGPGAGTTAAAGSSVVVPGCGCRAGVGTATMCRSGRKGAPDAFRCV